MADGADKGKRRRWPFVVGGILLVPILLVAGFLLYGLMATPPDPVAYEPPVSAETRERNAVVLATLATRSIDDAVFEADDARAYVAYNLPAGERDEAALESAQWFALGVAVAAAGDAPRAVVAQMVDGEPALVWVVEVDDYRAFIASDLTREGLEEEILEIRFGDAA